MGNEVLQVLSKGMGEGACAPRNTAITGSRRGRGKCAACADEKCVSRNELEVANRPRFPPPPPSPPPPPPSRRSPRSIPLLFPPASVLSPLKEEKSLADGMRLFSPFLEHIIPRRVMHLARLKRGNFSAKVAFSVDFLTG